MPFLPQERQSIIKYWLDNLRAKQGEVLHNIHFLEGQPISTAHSDTPFTATYKNTFKTERKNTVTVVASLTPVIVITSF